jgi:hypothetical protein
LFAEGKKPIRLHERLPRAYGELTVDEGTVRKGVGGIKEQETERVTALRDKL